MRRPGRKPSTPGELSRRDCLKTLLALPLAALPGCSRPLPFTGEITGASMTAGHRLRDARAAVPADIPAEDIEVVIVGGGLSGLAAGWRLLRAGFDQVE